MIEKFNEETVERVWKKGDPIPGYDPSLRRKDVCGATMRRTEHGNRNSSSGWEIDHIDPNGSDDIKNLRPLHWENNQEKSDKLDSDWTCAVTI